MNAPRTSAYLVNFGELGLVSRRTKELYRKAVEERLVVVRVDASRPHVLQIEGGEHQRTRSAHKQSIESAALINTRSNR